MELPAALEQAVQKRGWPSRAYSWFPIIGLSRTLLAEGGEQPSFERHEMRCGDHLEATRPGQVDHLYELHSTWPSCHDVQAIRQENSLVHVVRHEHNRLVQGCPES